MRGREAKLIEEGNKAQTAVGEATQGVHGGGEIDLDERSAVRRTEALLCLSLCERLHMGWT